MNKKIVAIVAAIVVVLAVGLGFSYHYQANHFNKNTTINGVNVGKLTARQALTKLMQTKTASKVYLGKTLIYSSSSATSSFSAADLSKIKAALKQQQTLLPSSKAINCTVTPTNANKSDQAKLVAAVKAKLEQLNQSRTKEQDAYAVLKNNTVSVVAAKKGTQYDVAKIIKQLKANSYDATVHLTASIKQPISANSQTVQAEKTALQAVATRSVTYEVEKTNYTLKASDIFTSLTYKNGKYSYDTSALNEKIAQINKAKATLGKKFSFTTHSGSTISVQGKTYGWKLSVKDATKTIVNAILTNKASVTAANDVYGTGYLTYGVGYGTTSNDGLGTTYAEVDISDQTVYIYKNGKCVLSVRTVTGKHSTGEDTPTGVFYVMYKQQNATLTGSESGNANYSVKVSYWAQFTNSGCGFHDATWRTNWSTTAYLTDGSGGCCNLHKADAAKVYALLSQGMPVIVHK